MSKKILYSLFCIAGILSYFFVLSAKETPDSSKTAADISKSATSGLDLSITITPYNPPITIPASGGNFKYAISVNGSEESPTTFQIWIEAILPNENTYGPVYGPADFHLPSGWSANSDLSQYVPGYAPPGNYTCIAHIGIYPDDIYDSDSFTLEKLVGGGWFSQSVGSYSTVRAVDFPDVNTGWAVGGAWNALHTTDGGDTWLIQDFQQPYPHSFNDLYFVDTHTGWVVGGIIIHTTDGGNNWMEQDSYYGYTFSSVTFVDADNGWGVANYSDFSGPPERVIEHTNNGGASWYGQLHEYDRPGFSSIHFTDRYNGWIAGNEGEILHTTNGGSTWNAQSSGTGRNLESVYFVDSTTGWCVGDDGTVLHTMDGGSNWFVQDAGTYADLESVYFIDHDTGWIAGDGFSHYRATIMHTTDGGNTWHAQDPGMLDDDVHLYDVFFIDDNHGWTAGGSFPATGAMLHTETGGE
jgi:photosystem II stability/assembly factor-like uncharacterized protein